MYFEEDVRDHPRVIALRRMFSGIPQVPCERYTEIFNRKSQNFRLQKLRPALILSRKQGECVLPAPVGYGLGGPANYYFSHMLNCIFDCRYCFLQGMYRSAHYVLFVNYEDFIEQIAHRARDLGDSEPIWFYSGYDCDSLALEPVSGFAEYVLDHFPWGTNRWLELRTKSTQVRSLLARAPIERCVVAFSLSPHIVVERLEHKTPSLARRLVAIRRLQDAGWTVGLRFDPLFSYRGSRNHHEEFFEQVFSVVDGERIHSVSLGGFRMPEGFFATIAKHYPEEPLFSLPWQRANGSISYPVAAHDELLKMGRELVQRHVPAQRIFECRDG